MISPPYTQTVIEFVVFLLTLAETDRTLPRPPRVVAVPVRLCQVSRANWHFSIAALAVALITVGEEVLAQLIIRPNILT